MSQEAAPFEIRPEAPGDVDAIRAVLVASFPTDAEARIVDALRTAGRLWVSLVAVVSGKVVGHVAFSRVHARGAEDGVGLAPLAVEPEHRRRGVGAALVREGLAACERQGGGYAVVLGDPAYYGRFGFVPAARSGLRGEHGGGRAFQVLALRPSGVPLGAGVVTYAPEFAPRA